MTASEASPETPSPKVTVIRPRSGWAGLGLGELWSYRELIQVFARRQVMLRYKQSSLGKAWALSQPLTVMFVISVFLGHGVGVETDKLEAGGESRPIPYSIFIYAALVPWTYFADAVRDASVSVIANRDVLAKVYFPRLAVLIAPVLSYLVDFSIALLPIVPMMAYYRIAPTAAIATLPLFILLAMLTALATGLWVAGLNAIYRDFGYIITFVLQCWFFATPVIYTIRNYPGHWKLLYGLNPMTTVVTGFRWALLGDEEARPGGATLWISTGVVVVLALTGLEFFRRMERTLVDKV